MDVSKKLVAAMLLAGLSCTVSAQPQRPYPGSDLMAPGTSAVGAPDYSMESKKAVVSKSGTLDKNGDGALDQSEIPPGSQLAKRLLTRDKNGDGKLSRDEYYFD